MIVSNAVRSLAAVAVLSPIVAGCGDTASDSSVAAAPASATTAAATATSAPAAPAASVVHLKLLSFEPAEVRIEPGTTVQWQNDNPIGHTVTSGEYEVGPDGLRTAETPDGTFDGKLATTGDAFSHTFPEAGTYSYYCSIHKGMNATLDVAP